MKRTAILAMILLTAGCTAKETRGMQMVHVTTSPAIQATCSLQNSAGNWYAITPGDTQVRRTKEPMLVRCENQAYIGQVQVVPSPDAWMLVASTVDGMTGPLYAYPERIVVPMQAR